MCFFSYVHKNTAIFQKTHISGANKGQVRGKSEASQRQLVVIL